MKRSLLIYTFLAMALCACNDNIVITTNEAVLDLGTLPFMISYKCVDNKLYSKLWGNPYQLSRTRSGRDVSCYVRDNK